MESISKKALIAKLNKMRNDAIRSNVKAVCDKYVGYNSGKIALAEELLEWIYEMELGH